eukprot:snap_masked-scaffold_4-processed-gene-11.55-mRNA-1 protein AED:1.00 eAED:1.00 QI:0/0/0/0/1/1/3/0/72
MSLYFSKLHKSIAHSGELYLLSYNVNLQKLHSKISTFQCWAAGFNSSWSHLVLDVIREKTNFKLIYDLNYDV